MKIKKSLFMMAALLVLCACRTSGEISKGKGYVDPTEVKTEDDSAPTPSSRGGAESSGADDLRRQIAILQGDLEASKVAHAREVENLKAQLQKAEAENQRHREVGAAEEAARNARPKNVEELWTQCLKNVDAQNHDKAVECFDDSITTYPKSAWLFHSQLGKGMALYNRGDFKQAALIFNQLIDRYPKKREISLAWFGQGSAFYKMGQRQDAKLFYTEVATRFPKSEEAPIAKRILDRKRVPPNDLFVAFPQWSKYAPQP